MIPAQPYLTQYIREDRCFLIQFPPDQPLDELETCIVNIATQPRWSENIPHQWVFMNSEINDKKISRILPFGDLHDRMLVKKDKKVQSAADMLRYYHDAGRVLFFDEEGLRDSVIIGVQWFVNAFKTIITDRLHVRGYLADHKNWKEYYTTGNLKNSLLLEIWKMKESEVKATPNMQDGEAKVNEKGNLLHHKGSMLQYMQRLGLMAVGRDLHYIPCMNKRKFEEIQKKFIQESTAKTSVLVYAFDFLPFFLFYQVVVACMQIRDWGVMESSGIKCLYKNAAMFKHESHDVAIFVTPCSIQFQVIRRGNGLKKDVTFKIRQSIDEILRNVTKTFHKHLSFRVGFTCMEKQDQVIGLDIDGIFIEESELKSGKEVRCPRHELENYHTVNADYLKYFWN
jgi:hypothetical protein